MLLFKTAEKWSLLTSLLSASARPQLECPTIVAAILVAGIGGTFQYGFCVSVMNAPSAVSDWRWDRRNLLPKCFFPLSNTRLSAWSVQHIKELVNLTCLQRYRVRLDQWQVSLIWSFLVSIFCVGGLLGSLSAGPLITRHGRLVLAAPSAVKVGTAEVCRTSKRRCRRETKSCRASLAECFQEVQQLWQVLEASDSRLRAAVVATLAEIPSLLDAFSGFSRIGGNNL